MTLVELKKLAAQDAVEPEIAAKLIAHTQALQFFLMDLTDWLASSPSPMKTATYYQIQARAQQLRNTIEPPKPTVSPLLMM